jgi:hypothetical protein
MKRLVVLAIAVLGLAGAGVVAYQMGWLSKLGLDRSPSATTSGSTTRQAGAPGQSAPGGAGATAAGTAEGGTAPPSGSPSTTEPAPSSASAPGPPGAPASQAPPATALDGTGAPLLAAPAFDGNVASIDFGGTLEYYTAYQNDTSDKQDVLAGRKESRWRQWNSHTPGPAELIVSFFAREPMVVERVVLRPLNGADADVKMFPKDVEISVSTAANPDGPFQQVATASLPAVPENGDASVSFGPVEARFLKLRMLTAQSGQDFGLSNLKVMEAKRPGYVPLLARHPEVQWPGGPNRLPAVKTAAADGESCAPPAPAAPPAHPESRRILLVGQQRDNTVAGSMFEAETTTLSPERRRPEFTLDPKFVAEVQDDVPQEERGVLTRALFRVVMPKHARPAILAPAFGFDTVILAQMCNGSDRMQALAKDFKQALMAWVANGHKLILQDSDDCVPGPDYSFVPFKFKTDTPGARGAPGFGLRFVESNPMLQPRAGRPGFLDVDAWVTEPRGRGYRNELGDANTFVGWDANWCGQLVVRNVHNVMGFALAYARYGRGLIIYDGFDNDQVRMPGYDEVVIRELAQGFDPDNLPCAARLGDFVVTTDTSLLQRAAVPGRTYTYPLTLLSNLGYTGTVNLAAAPQGGVSGMDTRFEPATIPLAGEGKSALSVTLPASLPAPVFALRVTGSDAAGKANSLCLNFGPPTTGELSIVSALAPPTRTRKNLEIILDASGSMKTAMGKQTRWGVALDTLQEVLARLPDDFNVGLRMYGHRESSRSPKTCTDSQLVVPIVKINRQNVLSRAKAFKPKGETPLVYSALQAPADLKAVGGGTVILITDGEESCKGDPVKAAAELKASGLDIRLNIVGFALKSAKTQKELAGFAQATGGLFYSAESGETLGEALMLAAIEKFPFTVSDAAGKVVLSGEANGATDALPPGDYKVTVKAGTRDLIAPRVSIAAGQTVTLKIALKNGQLVLE